MHSIDDKEDETLYKIDIIQSDEKEEERRTKEQQERSIIQHLMNKLDERERHVVTSYYGLSEKNKTLEEIGDDLQLSKERIRQVKEKSLRKLRSEMLILSD